jgi:hypothetical protein
MTQPIDMSVQIANAILAINSSAVFKCGETSNSIEWLEETSPISESDIDAKVAELAQAKIDEDAQKVTDKANAKAKLIAGEALTQAEADTIVL